MHLTRLELSHFRSHRRSVLDVDARPVAIHGPNGAGKTNLIEAVSMLSPGRMQLEDDKLILSVNAPDAGNAEEELVVAYQDEKLEIGFNAKYLLEIASQVDRENAVFLFNSSGDPTLMREGTDESAVYVVMPMRV